MDNVVCKVVSNTRGGMVHYTLESPSYIVTLLSVNERVHTDFKRKVEAFIKDLAKSISEEAFRAVGEEHIAVDIIKPSELN